MVTVYTQEQMQALAAAIARGARRVSYTSNGVSQTVEYHSLAEMQALLAEMRRQLEPRPKPRFSFTRYAR